MKRVCITCPGKKFDCLFLFLLLLTLITTLTLHSVELVIVVHNTLAEIESVKGKIQLNLVRTWGGDEVEDENQFFKDPWDIIIGKDSFIYISDFGNHRIQVFDEKGIYKRSIGRRGQGRGRTR
jgi:hypothetical protein